MSALHSYPADPWTPRDGCEATQGYGSGGYLSADLAHGSQLHPAMNALSMLFGATLVALGVLAAALADRIRGLKSSRDVMPREWVVRAAVPAIPMMEVVSEIPRQAAKPPRIPRVEPKAAPKGMDGGDDVIAALIGAGYKKAVATEAAWACSAAERATIEGWVACALRRCSRGVVS